MEKKLDLITGRPEIGKPEIVHPETGAIEQEEIKVNTTSYTRFTLPFAFQLQAIAKNPETNTLFYELVPARKFGKPCRLRVSAKIMS